MTFLIPAGHIPTLVRYNTSIDPPSPAPALSHAMIPNKYSRSLPHDALTSLYLSRIRNQLRGRSHSKIPVVGRVRSDEGVWARRAFLRAQLIRLFSYLKASAFPETSSPMINPKRPKTELKISMTRILTNLYTMLVSMLLADKGSTLQCGIRCICKRGAASVDSNRHTTDQVTHADSYACPE
jgi:hypothetical protein